MRLQAILAITLFLSFTIKAKADTIQVPGNYPTIQQAVDAAIDGDTVLVAPGIYIENIVILDKFINLISSDGAEVTIIDGGDPEAPQDGSCVRFENTSGKLEGFTLTNGKGYYDRGGGVYCGSAHPLIINNIIENNTVIMSGGGIGGQMSNPSIINNIIRNNTARGAGGIAVGASKIYNNVITGNTALIDSAGGISCFQYLWYPSEIKNNIIANNHANKTGGGIFCTYAVITNNTITGNTANEGGGGLMWSYSNGDTSISDNIFWGNYAPLGPELYLDATEYYDTFTISYSDVQGGQSSVYVDPSGILIWGSGMINSNPIFVDGYHLSQPPCQGLVSPCVNYGNGPMIDGSTRTDGVQDYGNIDMGFHYTNMYAKIPLGGSITGYKDPSYYKIYVPTKWGGELIIETTDGTIENIIDPEGLPFDTYPEVKQDQKGWYKFKVVNSSDFTVSNTFTQKGEASTVPWNFYYFPYQTDVRPNMFDDPGACTKYDNKFSPGIEAWLWEYLNHNNIGSDWWGHCWGGSIASIIYEQPPLIHPDNFTQDELEGLLSEYHNSFQQPGGADYDIRNGDIPSDITLLDTDYADMYVGKFHNAIRYQLYLNKSPFIINLLQPAKTTPAQVWNYACYKYTSEFMENPNALGNEEDEKPRQVLIKTNIYCNEDFVEPYNKSGVSIGDPISYHYRQQMTEYILLYTTNGEVMFNDKIAGAKQNWLHMTLKYDQSGPQNTEVWAPNWIFDPKRMKKDLIDPDHYSNPYITLQNLGTLGLNKNTGY